MSALASHSNSFSAHLALAAGVSVSISAPTLADLQQVVGKLQPTEAANDTPAPTTGKSKPAATPAQTAAATAPAGKPATQTTEPSAPAAAAQAAQGEAGNATPAGQAADASTASSTKPEGEAAVTFGALKKAFLALSTKADGRAKCEAVLKPFNLTKLSDSLPTEHRGKPADQVNDVACDAFAPILKAIEQASA